VSRIGGDCASTSVSLRPARPEDSHQLWRWRNDDESRRASFNSEFIPLERHEVWFRDTLQRADRRLYVILEDGTESGAVRLDISTDEAEVSIHLAPECRGRGLGTMALRALAEQAFGSLGLDRLVARVKPENTASRRAFLAAGFLVADEGHEVRLVRSKQ
jgi:RimJ/RimL family protein N-acetyltransferase